MAERLTVLRAVLPSTVAMPPPRSAEEEAMQQTGMEPMVQLFCGATEQKLSPNYEDYLLMRGRIGEASLNDENDTATSQGESSP